MKRLRITARIDEGRAAPFYAMLADASHIEETHLLEWNTTVRDLDTVLFAIRGDAEPFATVAPETQGIESVTLSATDREWTDALVEMRPQSIPTFAAIRQARTRPGLVVRKPIVYRDGAMSFRVVGDPTTLQAAIEASPDAMEVQLDEIETYRGAFERPAATLSDRQREAVEAAIELGYYDRPRGATHEDVADELDCAPPTASEHLQKAEATLVTAAMAGFGPGR